MEAVTPEVEFVGVQIARCALFPGDNPEDPPLIVRDVPVVVISPPWDDLADTPEWGYADDMKLGMTITNDCAHITVGLYDPWINFRVKVPLPEFDEQIVQALTIGWIGIQDENSEGCVVVRTKPVEG